MPSTAVPMLSLAPGEKAAYAQLAATLLQDTLCDYEAYAMSGHHVDDLHWKLAKASEGISVHKERRLSKREMLTPALLTIDGRYESVVSDISIPYMLVTGTMLGTVDDVVYGAFVDSTEAHKTRGFYIKDPASDFRILSHIESPTEDEPFKFCGIAWTNMGESGVPLVRRRDLLSLISSGITTAFDGERMGYYLIHSITHPRVRPLTDFKITRAMSSFIYLFRQCDVDRVEIFQKGFFAPRGDIPEAGVVAAVVKNLLAPMRLMDAAQAKKLRFMMQHAPPVAARKRRSEANSEEEDAGECAAGCDRVRSTSFSNSLPFAAGIDRFRRQHSQQGVCVICKLPVCSSCKIVKKIVVDTTVAQDEAVTHMALGFCIMCVNKSKTLSGADFARQELQEKKQLTRGSSRGHKEERPRNQSSTHSMGSRSPQPEEMFAAHHRQREQQPARHRHHSGELGVFLLPPGEERKHGRGSARRHVDDDRKVIEGIEKRGILL